ncbi:MAG TPA: two-component system response regulator KdpE [Methylophilaceae bacterium]|nr:two-component system response regulator KdpE [Methylophilaceae bacterium]
MSTLAPVIVLIEDEIQISRFVRAALEDEGCQVHEAATSAQGLIDAANRKPDLILLDLGLPDGDGIQVVESLRTWSSVPILILSARSSEQDKIAALDAGADDYLTKPFGVGELLARVRALLRRRMQGAESEPVANVGDLQLDFARRSVTRAGEAIHLTPIEYRLLCVLYASAGRVLTQRQILREVWGPGHAESNHYLRIFVGHLRQKIEADPAQPKHILTETGVGYRFHI